MELLNRLTTPEQVAAVFSVLTEAELEARGFRRDFRGRLIIDLSRQFHSGSVQLEKIWKMPIGEGEKQHWQPIAAEPSDESEVPADFVLYIFGAACQHPWFKARLEAYYGAIPEVDL
ncbi:hypothetical protein [Siphonobacter sp. SORGH_AS_0500]|uniref:hypothetical protein n=1 Tax=Siphonobacter sp. SORGH_AS_0500 TaxID=1864824 RepID=UPI002862D73A|nr:hypothetical protein [Siphonobacter sp. SORGH_AS_0500]MDR6194741.1 oxalate decarboxylase/phosphoglucose isomerase-like protein (cupin superfamily) [Siphonobacter sp. SORGH_AS_0500]